MKRTLLPNPNALLVETTGLRWHLVQAALMAGVVLFALLVALKFESFAVPVLLLVGLLGFVAIMARPLIGLLLVIFLIPFEYFQVIPGLDLTGSKLLSVVLVMVVAFHFVVARGSGIRRSPVDVPLLVFLLACVPGVAMAMEPKHALGKLISVVSYAVLFYLCGSLLRTRRELMIALWTFWFAVAALVGLTIMADVGLLRLGAFGGTLTFVGTQLVQRSAGSSANPAVFVMYPIYASAVALVLLRVTKAPVLRLVLLLSMLAFAYRIYLSYTRSSYLALAAIVAVYMWVFHRNRPVVVLMFLVAGLFAVASLMPDALMKHLTSGIALKEQSAYMRVEQVRAGIPVLLDNPIWGVGMGNTDFHLIGARVDGVVLMNTMHIQPLLVLLDTGLVGFGAYMWLLVTFFLTMYRGTMTTEDPTMKALIALGVMAFAGIMTHLMFHPLTYFSVHGLVFGLAFAAWAIARSEASESVTAEQPAVAPALPAE